MTTMNEEVFEPRNDLERQLVAAQEGRISGEQFLQELLLAQVFMPVRDRIGIGGFQDSTRATPLTLTAEDGTQVLVLFTSPERAKAFVRDFPGYEGGLLTELKWILEKVGLGYGISLNPGWPAGLDIEPDMLRELASH